LKILLLEDDRLFNETLKEFLEDEGFFVDSVFDPYSAFDLSYEKVYDLYLFDINLPFEDGVSALKKLRDAHDNTPTIFITSREDKKTLLKAFSIGADDYIKKPIDLDELLARVNAVKKRYIKNSKIAFDSYLLDKNRKALFYKDRDLELSIKEFALLELLIENSNKIVEYSQIYSKLWGMQEPNSAALRVYISRLKKIFPDSIDSIRGVGYIFKKELA